MPKQKLNLLPSAAFQILLSSADEDLHGYGIMRQVAEQTAGRMRLGPGTLYSSIQALEQKLIEEVESRENPEPGHERRRYGESTNEADYKAYHRFEVDSTVTFGHEAKPNQ